MQIKHIIRIVFKIIWFEVKVLMELIDDFDNYSFFSNFEIFETDLDLMLRNFTF